jgi:hypothetical protein
MKFTMDFDDSYIISKRFKEENYLSPSSLNLDQYSVNFWEYIGSICTPKFLKFIRLKSFALCLTYN